MRQAEQFLPAPSDHGLFWKAVAASLLLHFLLFHAGDLSLKFPGKREVEIDITAMGRMGAPGAPKKAAPPPAPAPPRPAAKPQEWLKPAANQKAAPAPAPTKQVEAPSPEPPSPAPTGGTGELSIGTGEGGEGQLARLPQLRNLSDLGAILQRFYPEKARSENREATVVLDIHIGSDGKISAVDIVQSADRDFDAAAVHVAKLLRFTPAFLGSQPVAVKMRQAIQFKLER